MTDKEAIAEILSSNIPNDKMHIAKNLDNMVSIKNDYYQQIKKLESANMDNITKKAEINKIKIAIIYCDNAIKKLFDDLGLNS